MTKKTQKDQLYNETMVNSQIYHNYGDKFDKYVVIVTSLLIVFSFVGVYALWSFYKSDCNHMEYTYCKSEIKTQKSDDHYHDDTKIDH